MAPSPRHLLESRLSELSVEMEALFTGAREGARRELADQLNQSVRRMGLAADREEITATLVDAAAQFAAGAALFRIDDAAAKAERVRGVSTEVEHAFRSLEIPLASAAALAGAVETRDPVVAAAAPSQISEEFARIMSHPAGARVAIFPVIESESVTALLYVWGGVQAPAIELLSQVAGVQLHALRPPAPPLISIAPAPKASRWDQLPLEEQRLHLRAQRFARVQAAEIRFFDPAMVETGRARRNLYRTLRQRIDSVRDVFHKKFFTNSSTMVDYLHIEILRTLANDDPELLGKDYPGPLV